MSSIRFLAFYYFCSRGRETLRPFVATGETAIYANVILKKGIIV